MAKRLLTACFALLPAVALADAPNPSFYLVNRSSQAINQAYVSPAAASGWGRDQLGDNTIDPGSNAPIRLHADGTCVFDLRIVYEDGRSEERRGVNTCSVDTITFGESNKGVVPPAPVTPTPPQSQFQATRDPSFRIINNASRDINEVYVRQAGAATWGRDRLGDDTIDADTTKVIRLPPGQCLWDVRFVFEGGRTLEKRRVNLCDVTDLPVP